MQDIIEKVVNQGYRPLIPEDVPEDIVSLIKSCWNQVPKNRPEASLIVSSLSNIGRMTIEVSV